MVTCSGVSHIALPELSFPSLCTIMLTKRKKRTKYCLIILERFVCIVLFPHCHRTDSWLNCGKSSATGAAHICMCISTVDDGFELQLTFHGGSGGGVGSIFCLVLCTNCVILCHLLLTGTTTTPSVPVECKLFSSITLAVWIGEFRADVGWWVAPKNPRWFICSTRQISGCVFSCRSTPCECDTLNGVHTLHFQLLF